MKGSGSWLPYLKVLNPELNMLWSIKAWYHRNMASPRVFLFQDGPILSELPYVGRNNGWFDVSSLNQPISMFDLGWNHVVPNYIRTMLMSTILSIQAYPEENMNWFEKQFHGQIYLKSPLSS